MGYRVIRAFVYSRAGIYYSAGDTFYAKTEQQKKDAETLIEAGFLERRTGSRSKTKASLKK